MAHVADYKKNVVKKVVDLINKYPIVGAVNMENMPAKQLQNMRKKLRSSVEMYMTKRRLFTIAIDEAAKGKKGLAEMKGNLKGMPAMLFTKDNPFKLFKIIKQSKSKAAAKPGQSAPNDIVVQAGPTQFAPGPVISELGAIGLKTKVENGKINIVEDATVAKEGEEISGELASMLLRLGIEPMEIGLDLVAVYEDGVIYKKDVLDVDEEQFMENLSNAARWSVNLAVEAAYPTKDVIEMLITKSFRETKGLALEANIMCDAVVEELLGKAEMQMGALKDTANIDVSKVEGEKEVAETPKEEAKAEEKPAEAEKKEEPKVEEKPKEEPVKVEEKPAEAEKKEEKPEEKPKEEVKPAPEAKEEIKTAVEDVKTDDTDKSVKKMVEDTKKFSEGKVETADDLLKEADAEEDKK